MAEFSSLSFDLLAFGQSIVQNIFGPQRAQKDVASIMLHQLLHSENGTKSCRWERKRPVQVYARTPKACCTSTHTILVRSGQSAQTHHHWPYYQLTFVKSPRSYISRCSTSLLSSPLCFQIFPSYARGDKQTKSNLHYRHSTLIPA